MNDKSSSLLAFFLTRNCPDYDLCEECEAKEGIHDNCHVFIKLRHPAKGVGLKDGKMVPLLKHCLYSKKPERGDKEKHGKHKVKELRQIAKDKIKDEKQKEKELRRRERMEEKLRRRQE